MDEELAAKPARDRRILARRKRVEQRRAALRIGGQEDDTKAQADLDLLEGKPQFNETSQRLERVHRLADQEVSAIRLQCDTKFSQRNLHEDLRKQALLQKLQEELDESLQKNAEVSEGELLGIESAFLQERKQLLSNGKEELSKQREKHNNIESAFLERYVKLAQDYQQQLESMRSADGEEFSILKMRLETDLQALEQHLESMRAVYQLNQEKLDYNCSVLSERENENSSTISQQKRRLSSFQSALSALKRRHAEVQQKLKEENQGLTDDYRQVTTAFQDLTSKCQQFQHAHMDRVRQVEEFKEDHLSALNVKLDRAQDVVHQQLLARDASRSPSKDSADLQTVSSRQAASPLLQWDSVELYLHKYYQLLKQRASTSEEVQKVKINNAKVQELLAQYLSASVTKHLLLPPIFLPA
ncbi:hypothetical protein WJX84_001227 [Apatococcus fuscideae]|uniref:Dynein regulatory complex protein 1 C-terminal domain-containing protein n=1 Tax=Apatococcus fuscideae TaxID=2026836 RepID=A0AAW1TA61_9CHLO